MRSPKLATSLGSLFIVLAASSGTAFAQNASSGGTAPYPASCPADRVPQAVSDSAHSIYQAGKVYYDDAKYPEAIEKFRSAYGKDCSKHDLLIIISRAYELNGDRAAAINALEVYLERVPNSPEATQHHTRIDNMKKQLAAQAAAAAASSAPPPPPPEVREHTVPPWIVVGVGGAAVVVGIVVVVTSPSLPFGCDAGTKRCMKLTPAEPMSQFNDRQQQAGVSQSQPTIGVVIAVAGGVLVAGGLLWHFLEPTGPVEKTAVVNKPKVTPQVAPGFAGLSLGGSF